MSPQPPADPASRGAGHPVDPDLACPQPSSVPAAPLVLHVRDEQGTDHLAALLVAHAPTGAKLHLSGDLGAGKTRLVRGLLRACGHTGRVRSPTFTLLEPYNLASFDLYHFDFYRFSSDNDWREAGFDDYLDDPRAWAVVEWPEHAGDTLPPPDLRIRLDPVDDDTGGTARRIALQAGTERGRAWLNAITDALRTGNGPGDGISFATD
jgi:tRNA threonylcarbamoyladenosine biosynthesis protein TsaE